MRISTNQIYDSGALGIQRNQQALYTLQNQLSTGRRVLSPEDDPVAAAQALVVAQSKELATQYAENQGNAKSQLSTLESNLGAITDLIQNVRERALQAGNGSLSNSERSFIASELQSRFDELMGLANSDDGTGQFLLSGYQGGGRPFAISGASAVAPALQSPVAYSGDDGERLIQVSGGRQMPINISGADLLMNIRAGNGTFATAVGGNSGGGINQGTATIDAGAVTNTSLWTAAVNTHDSFRIEFSNGGSGLEYQIYNQANVAMLASSAAFTPGQAISLQKTTAPAATFGAQVVVSGTPVAGDRFTIEPSPNQSLFKTLQNLIGTLQTPVGTASFSATEYNNRLGVELTNLDRALDNVSRVRADVGSRLKELVSLNDSAEDLKLQYSEVLSKLQDLDYTEAISKYSQQQVQFQAAQKSFAQISQLSLFDIL
ncbi:MAG: flagellar hook-associated protein FlgL [Betaproteobacteria bacterium]|uniref:Flagellar hook-associated protein FlgL n=1 Tax=Candidatus Proximibacter danicus TaxID=2954365 RepID=A0A9D7PQH3_9PROT|nr:flagellar hook-associated protein FlgL [Candidatus Proximibacter danicus]